MEVLQQAPAVHRVNEVTLLQSGPGGAADARLVDTIRKKAASNSQRTLPGSGQRGG